MKSICTSLVALLIVMASVSVPAFAADSSAVMGLHTMSGKVTHINHTTGWLRLKTDLGTLRLHYPPVTVKDVKKGEKITAQLGFMVGK